MFMRIMGKTIIRNTLNKNTAREEAVFRLFLTRFVAPPCPAILGCCGGSCRHGDAETSKKLLTLMRLDRVSPSVVSCNQVVLACEKAVRALLVSGCLIVLCFVGFALFCRIRFCVLSNFVVYFVGFVRGVIAEFFLCV